MVYAEGGPEGFSESRESALSRWDAATEDTLRVLVDRYRKLSLFKNASFLAERLYALHQSQRNLYLIASCYAAGGEHNRAYIILQRDMELEVSYEQASGPGSKAARDLNLANRYLFAQCCITMDKFREAEAALVQGTGLAQLGPHKCVEQVLAGLNDGKGVDCIPMGAAGLYLLGIICSRDNRREHATTYFALALKVDPFMWDAYEQLCALGVDIAPDAFFGNPLQEGSLLELQGSNVVIDKVLAKQYVSNAVAGSPAMASAASAAAVETRSVNENNANQDNIRIELDSERENAPKAAAVPVPVRGADASGAPFRYVAGLQFSGSGQGGVGDGAILSAGSRGRGKPGARRDGGAPIAGSVVPTGFSMANMAASWPEYASSKLENAEVVSLDTADQAIVKGAEGVSWPYFQSKNCAAGTPETSAAGGATGASSGTAVRKNPRRSARRSNGSEEGVEVNSGSQMRRSSRRLAENSASDASGAGGKPNSENFYISQNEITVAAASEKDFASKDGKDGKDGNLESGGGSKNEALEPVSSSGNAVAWRGGVLGNSENQGTKSGTGICLDAVVGSLQVLSLLCRLGKGVMLLSKYNCSDALEAFAQLPPSQQKTGWMAHQRGRARFEMGDYRAAKSEFQTMRELAPDRTAGLEIYSTNLWHLKEEVELCYLAQHALELDKRSPEAWICIGNCFSLQKEHDVAIKFFQRALQIDPNFTYAYTLSGHEYVSNEDFEKAIACYRHAIRTDARHYNAWYGLGTIYHRQEKFELAEYHFKRAININSRSSVLYCYLGMVLHAGQKCEEALTVLQRATDLEPSNPQAKFQRALVLRTMEFGEAALKELEAVRDFAPRESSVHFLMGKICKQLGKKNDAMLHFTTALDLDPKDSNLIKLAIDKLDNPNDMDETDGL